MLDAIHLFFRALPSVLHGFIESDRSIVGLVREDFDARRSDLQELVLGAVLEDAEPQQPPDDQPIATLELEMGWYQDGFFLSDPSLGLLSVNGKACRGAERLSWPTREFLAHRLAVPFARAGAQRSRAPLLDAQEQVWHQLFEAKHAMDQGTRGRYARTRRYIAQALNRGLIDIFREPETGRFEVYEELPEPNPARAAMPLACAGQGVVQCYQLLAPLLLSGARLAALDHPEAHLHAPSIGRLVRSLLQRMLDDKQLDQLFIATHSGLFDLDPTGSWDVSQDPATGSTCVARAASSGAPGGPPGWVAGVSGPGS